MGKLGKLGKLGKVTLNRKRVYCNNNSDPIL
jgi:hypothetical protein